MMNFIKKYSVEILLIGFITIIFSMYNLAKAQPTPGRIFTGNAAPSGRYNTYVLGRDIYCDTSNQTPKYYVSKVANVWHPAPGYGNTGSGGGGISSFTIGTVTTLGQAQPATATLTNPSAGVYVLDLGLTRGFKGIQGAQGIQGEVGATGATGATGSTGATGAPGTSGDRWTSTSVTSNSIGTGSKTFTIEDSLSYVPSQPIIIANSASNTMTGTVTSYNYTTGVIVLNIASTTGSGTHTSWSISLSGVQGPPGAQGNTGPTGATGPQGPQGIPGLPGGSSGWLGEVFTSPDKYGAVHAATTFAAAGYNQTQVDSGWGAAGALTTDMIDWAAWQMAIIEACDEQKAVQAYGVYYVNRSIQFEKYFVSCVIKGNYARVQTTNTNAFTVFGRPAPTDNTDALNFMVGSVYDIENLVIAAGVATDNQKGLEPGPNENSRFDGVWVTGMGDGIHLRFSLNTIVERCQMFQCYKGITADIGNWPGATASNSQSNVTTMRNCRAYVDQDLYGFAAYGSSGCVFENMIVEGSQCTNAFDFDALGSTNVYSGWWKNLHVECNYTVIPGATLSCLNSAVKIRALGGIFAIDGIYSQYATVNVDAEGTLSDANIKISNMFSLVPAPGGKYFRKRGTAGSWYFDWNDQLYFDLDDIKNKFTTDNGTGGTAGVQPNKKVLGVMGQGNGYVVVPSPR